jgi:hypothetical protein
MNMWLGNVVSAVRDNMQQQTDTALNEAAHLGLHATGKNYDDFVADESQFLELMAYRKLISHAEVGSTNDSRQFHNMCRAYHH